MNEAKFWTQNVSAAAETFNLDAVDGFTALSIIVLGGTTPTTVLGTLSLDGIASEVINIGAGESITIEAGQGKVLAGLTVVTSTTGETSLIAVQ